MNKSLPLENFSDLEARARRLSAVMPSLVLSARQIAHTLVHGSHGRKRAGSGETFWQFRPYNNIEPVQRIDWRRSASSQNLFVREKEWDTAHTIWLWIDLSPSMWFQSKLARTTKAERACLLGLAVAELLVRSGERVGVMGLKRPSMDRDLVPQIAERLIFGLKSDYASNGLPQVEDIRRFSEVILISDFLEPKPALIEKIQQIGANQIGGTMLHIIDPAEESLPFEGRVEFEDMQQQDTVVVENAGELRSQYMAAFKAHKVQLKEASQPLNWGYLQHHTDHPAREGLLHLYGFLASHFYATGGMSHEAKGQESPVIDNSSLTSREAL